jgi:hypothetical protein
VGAELGLGSEGLHLQALAGEGMAGAGQLPRVGDQQNGGTGVVLAQPGGGEGGVLPGGAGGGVAGDAGGGTTELHKALGSGTGVTGHIGATAWPWRRRWAAASVQAALASPRQSSTTTAAWPKDGAAVSWLCCQPLSRAVARGL